jgi:hydroxymethylglutaryl-CoA synthase
LATYSFTTDTPDFWRREYQYYPQHGGRFTGDPAYFKHITGSARGILKQTGLKPEDFAYVIFHQPNGKFPLRVGEILGFKKPQIEPGWLVPLLGNTYSGSSPLGLTATLDIAKPGDKILLVSYGSGAGSDSFVLKVTPRIDEVRSLAPRTRDLLNANKRYLEYGEYAKFRHKIRKAE